MAVPPTKKFGLRNLILAISPPWLTRGTLPTDPGTGGRLMYAMGLLADATLEKLDQGMRAHMPGYGTQTALPFLGADRQLVQAPAEANTAFITRLKQFLQTWQTAGSSAAVLRQVLCYFQPYLPRVTMVSNSGVWDYFDFGSSSYASTPPIHVQLVSWAWDNVVSPITGSPAWWRVWLLVAPGLTLAGGSVAGATNASPIVVATAVPHGLSTGGQVAISGVAGNLAANGYWTITRVDSTHFSLNGSTGSGAYTSGGTVYSIPATVLKTPSGQVVGPAPFVWGQPGVKWGTNGNVSWGFNAPSSFFQPIRQLAGVWKSAHSWLRWVMFTFDTGWGSPWLGPNPSGGTGLHEWGTFAWTVGGVSVASRNPNTRSVDGIS